MGDHGLRLRGGDLAPVRRHLPQQLHQERARPGAGRRPRSASSCCGPSRPTRPSRSPSTSTGRTLAAPAIGLEVDVPARRRHPAPVPRRASTTSASPSRAKAASPPTRPAARRGCPRPTPDAPTHGPQVLRRGLRRNE